MHKLILGDGVEFMKTLPPASVDMVLTDPPFGTTSNNWDSLIPVDPMFTEARRVIKPGGAIAFHAKDRFSATLIYNYSKYYKHRWIWHKRTPGNFAVAKHMPMSVDEDILIFTSGGERVNYCPLMVKGKERLRGSKSSTKFARGFGGMEQVYYRSDEYYPQSIITCPVVPRRASRHPSQKPVELVAYLIMTYTAPGETVLDFAMGAGTTIEACIRTNRYGVGVEINPEIFADTVAYLKEPSGRYNLNLLKSRGAL